MHAGYMNTDIRPRQDRECRFSAISLAHCQGGVFRGYLLDNPQLITNKILWPRSSGHIQLNVLGGCR